MPDCGLRPLGNRVAVTPLPQPSLSDVIYVPGEKTTWDRGHDGTPIEAVTRGTVVSKGPKCKMDFDIGDVVRFSDSCSNEVEVEGNRYRVFREDDIIGVE